MNIFSGKSSLSIHSIVFNVNISFECDFIIFHYRSDSEPALVWALKKNFRDSIWLACQIHLERNAKSDCLANTMKEQNELMKQLFHEKTGLSASNSLEEFEERKALIDPSKFKNFESLCTRILDGIVNVRIIEPRIRVNWKSQDVESKNHTLKSTPTGHL